MARKAREKSAAGVYAVTLKGNKKIFSAKKMKEEFLNAAGRYLGDGLLGCRFSADKAELLVKESPKGISVDMKPLTTSFARAYNKANNTEGKVFADRFKSVPVGDDELQKACIAYLEGGKPAAPFESRARRTAAKPESVREELKPVPKQRNTMPSWLL